MDQDPIDIERLSLQLRMSLVSTPESINDAAERILAIAETQGCNGDDLTDMGIAVREALANAIIHGNQQDPDKRVLLRCYCNPDVGILITVRDEGPGFDPEGVPDPRGAERIHLHHGRGIFLMRELMDYVEHRAGGREVRLYKRCSTDGGAEPSFDDEDSTG